MAGPLMTKDACRNCVRYSPRDPDLNWPRAGISPRATGQCGIRRLGEDTRPWVHETSWCAEHKSSDYDRRT